MRRARLPYILSSMSDDSHGLLRFFEIFDLVPSQLDMDNGCNDMHTKLANGLGQVAPTHRSGALGLKKELEGTFCQTHRWIRLENASRAAGPVQFCFRSWGRALSQSAPASESHGDMEFFSLSIHIQSSLFAMRAAPATSPAKSPRRSQDRRSRRPWRRVTSGRGRGEGRGAEGEIAGAADREARDNVCANSLRAAAGASRDGDARVARVRVPRRTAHLNFPLRPGMKVLELLLVADNPREVVQEMLTKVTERLEKNELEEGNLVTRIRRIMGILEGGGIVMDVHVLLREDAPIHPTQR
ncbi:hypothetical protein C8R45DRAFT_1068120 [Mycena sanguinolenta]|nr:hypothetical protein C8R45DRAFT_1068120 [Mycena sanguinolenta]